MKTILIAALLLVSAGVSRADTLWTYTGNSTSDPGVGTLGPSAFIPTPNPCNCALSGWVTLDASGQAVAWDFTSGSLELTGCDSTLTIGTGLFAAGQPFNGTNWILSILGPDARILSVFEGSLFESNDIVMLGGSQYEYEQGHPGQWCAVPTPEPSTLGLLLTGAVVFLLLLRRR